MSEKQIEAVSQEMLDNFARMETTEVSENYRIIGKQGAGGCSVVYDAWHISDGRHVAIKVLALPEGLDAAEAETSKKRFFREARILASLKNEHSVECIEYGLFNGAPCVVLEFVEGKQLDEYLREFGALPFDYGVGIVCQILEALDEAHRKGIIHRDIKPANILVIQNSQPPVVRLIDFGIATLQEGALGEMMKTRLGVVRGTPAYMAPELFTGQVSATPESDIYAIGLVLCEILTGTVCVSGASLLQIAFKQANEELEIPVLIPDCLAKIIRKCCEKDADKRYHSAQEVSAELKRVLPEAMQQRSACEAAYLKSIKEGPAVKAPRKGFPVGLVVGLIVTIGLLIGVASFSGYTHIKMAEDEAAAKAAAQEELERAAAETAAKAEAERMAMEAANAEAIKKAAEEAAAAAAAKATADAQAAIDAERARADERVAAERASAAVAAAEAEKRKAAAEEQLRRSREKERNNRNSRSNSDPKTAQNSNPTPVNTNVGIPTGLL